MALLSIGFSLSDLCALRLNGLDHRRNDELNRALAPEKSAFGSGGPEPRFTSDGGVVCNISWKRLILRRISRKTDHLPGVRARS